MTIKLKKTILITLILVVLGIATYFIISYFRREKSILLDATLIKDIKLDIEEHLC